MARLSWPITQLFTSIAMRDLLSADRHSPQVTRERCSLIISRVQMSAHLFAILTVSWILVDTLTIGWPLWGVLAAGRLLAAAAFLVLARHRFAAENVATARQALAAFIGIAIAFFLSASVLFWLFPSDEQSTFATTTYFYAPFLIAAGLGMLPLTIVESAAAAVPVLSAMSLSLYLLPEALGTISASATLWRLMLIAAIGSIAGMNQLGFLINLTEQSARDNLTGALNRKFGEQLLHLQFAAAQRNGRPLSLLFVDLDHFKSVNDEFGHEAGDAVLQRAAQSLRDNLRRHDIVVRWGGEEFLVILPDTDSVNAEAAIRRMGTAGIGLRPDGMPQTASVGIADRITDLAGDWATLVKLADNRMYKAKHAGRNCFVGMNGQPVPFVTAKPEYRDEACRPPNVAPERGPLLANVIGPQLTPA